MLQHRRQYHAAAVTVKQRLAVSLLLPYDLTVPSVGERQRFHVLYDSQPLGSVGLLPAGLLVQLALQFIRRFGEKFLGSESLGRERLGAVEPAGLHRGVEIGDLGEMRGHRLLVFRREIKRMPRFHDIHRLVKSVCGTFRLKEILHLAVGGKAVSPAA